MRQSRSYRAPALTDRGRSARAFHGFLQERAIQKANGREVGPALLFLGITHPDVDYLYWDEFVAWEDAGVVSVRPAFSPVPEREVTYVQHRVWQDRADVADLFRQGARFFVYGETTAPAVRATCLRIYQEAQGVAAEDADVWANQIERKTGPYVADVFD